MVNWLSDIEPFAVQHQLEFFDFAGVELAEGLEDEDRDAISAAVHKNQLLTLLFQQGPATFYQVTPPKTATSDNTAAGQPR